MDNKTLKNENHNLKELTVQYHRMGYDIAQTYTRKTEGYFYSFVCKKIEEKYPNLFSAKEIEGLIKDNGRIVTVSSIIEKGFYDYRRNVIAIGHYLDRMTTTLFHECVHKISYLKGKGMIEKLPSVYKEAGTEIITSESLKTKDTYGYVFGNVWAKMPNTVTSYFLECNLVKQLNYIAGNQSIERTILNGDLTFERELKRKIGEKEYGEITGLITKIEEDFREFSIYHSINSQNTNMNLEQNLKDNLDDVQQRILALAFNKKISVASSIEEANGVLEEMLKFADYRMRYVEKKKLVDKSFEKNFENAKKTFEERFGGHKFEQKFNPSNWMSNCSKYVDVEQVSSEEQEEIRKEGKRRYKLVKPSSFLGLFKKENTNELPKPVEYKRVTHEKIEEDFFKTIEIPNINMRPSATKSERKKEKTDKKAKSQDVK